MQLGMIGLGRMGANMVRRLMRDQHDCVVFDADANVVKELVAEGATGSNNLQQLVDHMQSPRAIWLMIPSALVDKVIAELEPLLSKGDIIVDGGNSYYKDDIVRARRLTEKNLHYLDVGTSGGVWGLERGYCMMIGGDDIAVAQLQPVFKTLAPGMGEIDRTGGRSGNPSSSELGYLHCGPAGSGHYVKMVHNGIEYGLMAAYAEGFNLLRHANVGMASHAHDAETTPLRDPDEFKYEIDVAEVAEVWRRGSVVASWLLDLTAHALHKDNNLENFGGRVSDSGEGRWTSIAAIESGTPAHVLTAALFSRFSSRDEDEYANKLLSAMRFEFGGHHEK